MASTAYITYRISDGEIVSSRFGPAGASPEPATGHGVLDAGRRDALPTGRTHRVDPGPPAALVARPAGDLQAERDAERRERLRQDIALLEVARSRYLARRWGTEALDARVALLLAQHDAIP